MIPGPAEPAALAIFAKAPIPGYAKTRLIPVLGPEGAASLQVRLTERALQVAAGADLRPVTLWCAPDTSHVSFQTLAERFGCRLRAQIGKDLGARMLAAFAEAPRRLVLIGTDCPCLEPGDLQTAAAALREGADAVIAAAEDGGYGLIGASRAIPSLFEEMPWGTDKVAALTRERAEAAGLRLHELRSVWDVDTPEDYARLVREGLLGELS